MPVHRAVLFDFFGTLTRAVQRGPQHAAVARALGCDPAALVTVLDASFYARSCGLFGSADATLAWLCEQVGTRPTRTRLRAAHAARVAAVRADTRLRADAAAALRRLRRRGFGTAVVSDCGYELPEFLPQMPIRPLLDACIYSVDVGKCKPHPAMYLAACERLGVRPEECGYIGDGGSRELTGARDLGMRAIRLAAADSRDHLVFDAEDGWAGPNAPSLTDAVALLARTAPVA